MTVSMKLEGMEGMKAFWASFNLRKASQFRRGLEKAAKFLLKESQKVVPVDTGFLKKSGYYTMSGKYFFSSAEVGYSAPYAIYVHENVHHNFRNGKMAKYLTYTAMMNQEKISQLIHSEMSGI